MENIALCPGTYDPITEGHRDVINRSARVFDKVIVAVSKSNRKKPVYSLAQRVEVARKCDSQGIEGHIRF